MRHAVLMGSLSVVALTALWVPALKAQEERGESDDDLFTLEEVVVTARKREERLQDTPIAISAFTAAEIQDAGFESVLDIGLATPGVNIEAFNSSPGRLDTQPRFRGVIFDAASQPLARTALTLIDGVVVTGGIQGLGLDELERVEVIKGPQSALFGRNSFSGAINYVTRDPGDDFGITASFLGATRDEYRFSGSVESPVIKDILSLRINGSYDFNGGHFDNVAVPGQELGEEVTFSVGGVAVFTPIDRVKLKVRAQYYQDNDGPAAIQAVAGVTTHNFGGFPIGPDGVGDTSVPFSGVPFLFAIGATPGTLTESVFQGVVTTPPSDFLGLNTSDETFDIVTAGLEGTEFLDNLGISPGELGGFGIRRETFRLTGGLETQITDSINFDILFGYSDEAVLGVFDFDGTPDESIISSTAFDIEDFSIEGRFSGTAFSDRLAWSVGANVYDADVLVDGGFAGGSGALTFGTPIFGSPVPTSVQTVGVFWTADYAILDNLSLSFEGRFQFDQISEPTVNEGLAEPISPETFTSFLPRVVLSYEPVENTLLYFNFAQGNLPGGFNTEVAALALADPAAFEELLVEIPGVGATFDEETLTNYEIGWKQSFPEQRLSFNLAAFFMQRNDEIVETIAAVSDNLSPDPDAFQTLNATINGATTRIFGIEVDARWQATEYLSFQGSVGYVNSEIESFPADADAGDFADVFGPGASVAGQQAPRFPPVSGSLGATYERPFELLGLFDRWYARGDAFYVSSFFDSNTNVTEIGERYDVNLRTGFRGENVSLEFFVTNVTGEDTPLGINNIADTSAASIALSPIGIFGAFPREGAQVALHQLRQFGGRLTFRY